MSVRYLTELERAASALKAGIDERNAASLAYARAKTQEERHAATIRHQNAYQRLEALKQALIAAASGRQAAQATGSD
jgi:hypothetical protein